MIKSTLVIGAYEDLPSANAPNFNVIIQRDDYEDWITLQIVGPDKAVQCKVGLTTLRIAIGKI